ncbi:MAG: hypothetical protein KKA55_01650 [Proteobacteria bacterium]|nr:hypothetical protein [Pseudomonadota bacterium]MBU1594224.1 hypothetical protein [Pseudomonadota bacterium]
MDRYKTFADALESEVLTEMAGTFFGARKALEEYLEDFHLDVESLRSMEARVFSRALFLRSLLLGPEGEAALFAEIGVAPPFADSRRHSGSRTWHPERLPFALFTGARYAKAVLLAYAEVRQACEVYMSGEYEDDPVQKGRKRLSLHYRQVERQCQRLNERIGRLNTEMTPSSVLQYARSISMVDQPGHGTLSNSLGAESLDKGLQFQPVDFASLGLWVAPSLPPVEACEKDILRFCARQFKLHGPQIKKVLADLD